MRYVLILVVIVLFVRIDYLMGLFDKASEKLGTSDAPAEVSETISSREVIPVTKDLSLQKTPKETFLALLEDFRSAPVQDIRDRAVTILREDPTIFSDKLDKDLEAHIFRWRDLLNNNDPQVVNFMLDLMNTLKGENQEIIRRFFSLWMDINMEHFIAAYTRTKDTNCSIATVFGYQLQDDEKINEYVERQEALTLFLTKEKIDPVHRALATNCSLQLKIIIEKLAPAPLNNSEESNVPASSTTISPMPDQGPMP